LLAQPVAEQERILEHAFLGDEGRVILDCSVGRYMNHGCDANVLETPQGFDIAVRDIAAGEEAVCDYRRFAEPIEVAFPCRCGAAECAGRVECGQPGPALERTWAARLEAALAALRVPAAFRSGIEPGRGRRFGGERFYRQFGRSPIHPAGGMDRSAVPASARVPRSPSQTTS
jgi:hypothetical protein